MFKQVVCSGTLALVLLNLVASACLAVPLNAVPNPRRVDGGWVSDTAQILAPETEAELNRQISALEARNSSEIAVVTVPDVAPAASVKAFGRELFNTWGIGKKDKNNGVLLLVSKGDRRIEIIVGKGLETLLTDRQVSAILHQDITPRFKQRQFDAGVLVGTKDLIGQLNRYRPDATPTAAHPPSGLAQRPGQNQVGRSSVPPNSSPTTSAPVAPAGETAALGQVTQALIATLVGLTAGILAVVVVLVFRRRGDRVLLAPEGDSRIKKSAITGRERFHCATCQRRMQRLTSGELSLFLTQPQQTAEQLGSVVYEGWRCTPCQPSLYGRGFHLRASVIDAEQFSHCSVCNELTAVHTVEVLQPATWNQTGKRRLTHDCRCCAKHWQTEEEIPRLPLPHNAVILPPTGRSRVESAQFFEPSEPQLPTHCSRCHYPMKQLNPAEIQLLLRQPEQVAQSLGSVAFIGWRCPHCFPDRPTLNPDLASLHLRAYGLISHYQRCPHCQEFTIAETATTVQPATTEREGRRQITRRCQCCAYTDEYWQSLPRQIVASHSASWHSSWSSSDSSMPDSSSNSSSSWSSGDSWSGGSDFGGGSSDGGGAGDSW